MLDVNNDQQASDSSEKELNKKSEAAPVKKEEKKVKDELVNDQIEEGQKDDSEASEEIKETVDEKATKDLQEEVIKEVETSTEEVRETAAAKEEENKETQEVQKETVAAGKKELEDEKPKQEETPKVEEKESSAVAGDSTEIAVDVKKEEDAEVSEKIEEKKVADIPSFDLATMSMDDIILMLQKLLNDFEIKDIKNQVESLKIDFQKKFSAFLKEQKEAFIAGGGEESEFFLSSTIKHKFDELISTYKRKRQHFYKELERTQKENLELKLALIDQLKELIDNAEASTMYRSFRTLEERWRAIGQIPHAKYNDVWRTYHHHVERFYDLLHMNNDFRDLDFRHNLEEKTKLIKKADALAEEEDVNHAFKELQILHKMWKEDIGPVAREFREEIWHKFSEATKKIHKKRHEFQDRLDEKYKANVGLKMAVIEKIKAIDPNKNTNHKEWQQSIKKLEALRDEFFAIGRVPKSKNEEIWQLFRAATRDFNSQKNSFYKGIKSEQNDNLKKKQELVDQAKSLKDSEDWEMATEVFKKIQAEWKKIGHVPRRYSDKIWKEFKDACNHYFDRLHDKKSDADKDQSALIDKKKQFMDELKKEIEAGKDLSLEFVQKGMDQWRNLGVLPHKVKHLDIKFHKLLDSAYKKLNIGKDEAVFLRFKSSVDSLLDQKNFRKLDSEQLFIRRKIDEITKEIKQLENNISFISNASADNPLVKNVYKNIEEYKKSLDLWKRKIDYMKKLDY